MYENLKKKYAPVDSDGSINDCFNSQTIYCPILLSNFTKNKEAFDRRIPQSSESREVTLFSFENTCCYEPGVTRKKKQATNNNN